MTSFLQLHILTEYPISNPNRDDLGRPKSARIGGVERQRISSQALKRAIRTHPAFEEALDGNLGVRTAVFGDAVRQHLIAKNASAEKAESIALQIAELFGKPDKDNKADKTALGQIAFISPAERKKALSLADDALAGKTLDERKKLGLDVLLKADGAIDIAMFGRMLTGEKDKYDISGFSRDAAVQVAHAFTVNRVVVEDDYYTALDELSGKVGAGFIGEAGFGSGVYYLYVCVDRDLLVKNLGGDDTAKVLAGRGLDAFVKAVAHAVPGGKMNSFANRARAKFILAEKGSAQPLNLAGAFTRPVTGPDFIGEAVAALKKEREDFAAIYGRGCDEDRMMHVGDPQSVTLDAIAAFAAEGVDALDGK